MQIYLCDLDKKCIHILYTHQVDFHSEDAGHEALEDISNPLRECNHDCHLVCIFSRHRVLLFLDP